MLASTAGANLLARLAASWRRSVHRALPTSRAQKSASSWPSALQPPKTITCSRNTGGGRMVRGAILLRSAWRWCTARAAVLMCLLATGATNLTVLAALSAADIC